MESWNFNPSYQFHFFYNRYYTTFIFVKETAEWGITLSSPRVTSITSVKKDLSSFSAYTAAIGHVWSDLNLVKT